MPWCVVIGCRNNMKATKSIEKNVSYHIFPKNPQRRSAWINTLNRPFKLNADSTYICSEHFTSDDFECNSLKEELLNIKVKKQLKKTAIPSINIPKISGEEEQVSVNHITDQSTNKNNTLNNFSSIGKFHMQQPCAVSTCKNNTYKLDKLNSSKEIVLHKFPSNNDVFEKWLEFCKCSKEFFLRHQDIQICSEHFNEDNYELKYTTKLADPIKELKKDAVPHLNGVIKVEDIRNVNDEAVKKRKMIVDKLLADYEEQQKNEGLLNGITTKYSSFFSPKINSNTKLADKLKLLKAIDNPEPYSPPKKRKTSKSNSEILGLPFSNNSFQNKDQVIQVSAVKGGLMLHALPLQTTNNVLNTGSEKNDIDEEEEIIIVTKDEAKNAYLSPYDEEYKENNTEIIVVTNLKETEDTIRYEDSVPINKMNEGVNKKCCTQSLLENNERQSTPLYTTKVSLMEDKGCQVIVPCKGCENRSLKINKLLRERTRLLKDFNQNGTWKHLDEITTLKKMNGVLSLLLLQCVGKKKGKKSSSIRVDLVEDSIERINRGWSMHDTSETLCQALSGNAYDEFARTFKIINEI